MRVALLAVGTLLIHLLLPSGARGQTAVDPVPEILDAYQQVDYERAEALARAALADLDGLRPGQLVEIHKVMAFISLSRGYDDEAERHFISALSLEPDLTLDPALVSPVVIGFFEDVKANADLDVAVPEAAVRYVVVQDVRAAAALRSLIVPGWGQLYKDHPARGGAFLAVWAGAATAAVLGHARYHDARDRYDGATDPAAIAEAYDEMNRWYRVRNNFALGGAAVWAGAVLEAWLSPGVRTSRLQFEGGAGGAALRLRL